MRFALNYSLPAAQLVKSGRIKIDLFKCPEWEDAVKEASRIAPVYVHFRLQAGRHNVEEVGLERIRTFLETTSTLVVNAHFSPLASLTGEPPNVDLAVEAAKDDLRILAEYFGADRVVLENIPWLAIAPHVSTVVSSTSVISRVIRESGVGLLLDIAHARLAAESMDRSPQDFILELPVDRLKEVHVTGIGPHPSGGRIDHKPMTEEDWELFEWTLSQIKCGVFATPAMVTCEYGGIGEPFASNTSEDVILEQIPRMFAMVKEASPQ
jgi:uncharacterized protein